jgi:acyl phosphate:glycerol-3-phosphate acyltransferase
MNFYLFLVFIISYLLGSFPTAYLIIKKSSGQDIRTIGTGNVGAMNVQRATGKVYLFIITFLIDAAKAVLAIYLAQKFSFLGYDLNLAVTVAAFGAVVGHCWPVFLKFQGGKAIASLIGIFAYLNFQWLLIPWASICLIYIFLTGYLFLGQFMGTVFLPFIGYFVAPEYFWLCVLVAIPVFIKQWPRFIPMLKGQEPKWYWKLPKKS